MLNLDDVILPKSVKDDGGIVFGESAIVIKLEIAEANSEKAVVKSLRSSACKVNGITI